jgi:type I restriction enzyme S subunit
VSFVFPTRRLSELATKIDYGVTASASAVDTGTKFLRITDIQDGSVDWPTVPFCEAPQRKLLSARLDDGDIVFARTGATTGKSFLIKSPPNGAVFASYLIRVKPSRAVDASYLSHFFQSPGYWGQIEKKTQGAAQGGVNATSLSELQIPLPPLDEQRRIGAILDKADALRRKRKRALELLESLTESIFLEMFGDLRNNSKGWNEIRSLGNLAEIVSGITKGRKLNGEATREVPYLAVANVQDKFLDMSMVKTIEATQSEIERYRLKKYDLLLTEGGDPDKLGRGTLWGNELGESIHQNHIFRVRVCSSEVLPLYLIWLLGSAYGKAYFLRSAKQTTGIASINKRQLSDFPVILPPVSLQGEFGKRADFVTKMVEAEKSAATMNDDLFSFLQYRAFSGQL